MKLFFKKQSLLLYNSDNSKTDYCTYRVVLDGLGSQSQAVLG